MKKSAVSLSSTAQRLETTAGTPAEKNALASDDVPSRGGQLSVAGAAPRDITSFVLGNRH